MIAFPTHIVSSNAPIHVVKSTHNLPIVLLLPSHWVTAAGAQDY
jgi:hypothetical protein